MSGNVERRDVSGIAWLTLKHPERRNAVTPTILSDLRHHLEQASEDETVRVVALRGDGPHAFSAGYDLRSFGDAAQTPADAADHLSKTLQILADVPKPTVAVLNGHAIGAGCEIAVTCDIRWARAGVLLGMPPGRLGLVYAASGVARFLSLIGPAHTAELFYSATNIPAERAAAIGLVNETFDADGFEREVDDRLSRIAAMAPLSHAGHAFALRRLAAARLSDDDAVRFEEMRERAFRSDDAAEGLASFLEKRDPAFKGN